MLNSDGMSQLGGSAKTVSETVKQTQDKTTSDGDVLEEPLKSVGGCTRKVCQS